MSPRPRFPLAEAVGVAVVIWSFLTFLCIPLQEGLRAAVSCLFLPTFEHFPTCVVISSLLGMPDYWFGAKADVGSVVPRHWPAGLMAFAFTIMLLSRGWRRR